MASLRVYPLGVKNQSAFVREDYGGQECKMQSAFVPWRELWRTRIVESAAGRRPLRDCGGWL